MNNGAATAECGIRCPDGADVVVVAVAPVACAVPLTIAGRIFESILIEKESFKSIDISRIWVYLFSSTFCDV